MRNGRILRWLVKISGINGFMNKKKDKGKAEDEGFRDHGCVLNNDMCVIKPDLVIHLSFIKL